MYKYINTKDEHYLKGQKDHCVYAEFRIFTDRGLLEIHSETTNLGPR